jgi:hypothetical protein
MNLYTIFNFLLYFAYGLFFKNQFILIILFCVGWGLFEKLVITNPSIYHLTSKYWPIPEKYWTKTWDSNIFYMIINFIAYATGHIIYL